LFEKDKDVDWKAGQHGLFSITHKKINKPLRPFTVSSAPSENVIRITMNIGDNPSEFKQAIQELKPGMKMSMSGPVGGFFLQDGSPSLLIAGGIGITPFRSFLKQLAAEGNASKQPIRLLYMDSKKAYPFKDELDRLAAEASATIVYLDSREELYKEIDQFVSSHKNNGKYYISGAKSMVDSIAKHVRSGGVAKGNIKKDSFFGY
jgi:ferredoxin-NADP reductase